MVFRGWGQWNNTKSSVLSGMVACAASGPQNTPIHLKLPQLAAVLGSPLQFSPSFPQMLTDPDEETTQQVVPDAAIPSSLPGGLHMEGREGKTGSF